MKRLLVFVCVVLVALSSSALGGVMLRSADARPAAIIYFSPAGVPPYPCTVERAGNEWCNPDTGSLYRCLCFFAPGGFLECQWFRIT